MRTNAGISTPLPARSHAPSNGMRELDAEMERRAAIVEHRVLAVDFYNCCFNLLNQISCGQQDTVFITRSQGSLCVSSFDHQMSIGFPLLDAGLRETKRAGEFGKPRWEDQALTYFVDRSEHPGCLMPFRSCAVRYADDHDVTNYADVKRLRSGSVMVKFRLVRGSVRSVAIPPIEPGHHAMYGNNWKV